MEKTFIALIESERNLLKQIFPDLVVDKILGYVHERFSEINQIHIEKHGYFDPFMLYGQMDPQKQISWYNLQTQMFSRFLNEHYDDEEFAELLDRLDS